MRILSLTSQRDARRRLHIHIAYIPYTARETLHTSLRHTGGAGQWVAQPRRAQRRALECSCSSMSETCTKETGQLQCFGCAENSPGTHCALSSPILLSFVSTRLLALRGARACPVPPSDRLPAPLAHPAKQRGPTTHGPSGTYGCSAASCRVHREMKCREELNDSDIRHSCT